MFSLGNIAKMDAPAKGPVQLELFGDSDVGKEEGE